MIIYVTIYDEITYAQYVTYVTIYDDHITVQQCNPHFSLPGRTLSPPGLPVTGISSNLDFTMMAKKPLNNLQFCKF